MFLGCFYLSEPTRDLPDFSYLSDTGSSISQKQYAICLGSSYLSEPAHDSPRFFLSLRDRYVLSLRGNPQLA
jgi:hypothetical protein